MNALLTQIPAEIAGGPWSVNLRCTICARALPSIDLLSAEDASCLCGFVLRRRDGIVRTITPERALYFRQFTEEYGAVRSREGRGATDDACYLALPYEDRTGRNAWQWSIRAQTFRYLERRLLPQIESSTGRPLDILDLGAGNGWLSYRLTLRGHRCAAVDLLDNSWDGLGAAKHYLANLDRPFAVVQAEMDRLPFAGQQFDLVIFNASFHYSSDYAETLRETLRCLRPGGSVLVLDTPYYHRESSGAAMVRERQAAFEKQYGFRSNSVPSREYVTNASLKALQKECGIRWRIFKPWYGWNWAVRPWKARLRRKREPSKFFILWGRPKA
jgi:ubiquinone/menaquinone biosynthesis C-methylase UbiE